MEFSHLHALPADAALAQASLWVVRVVSAAAHDAASLLTVQ
jgi:hypothetical protein